MAQQQASRTFHWVFGDGLKARKPGGSGRKTWKSLPDLTFVVLGDILEYPH